MLPSAHTSLARILTLVLSTALILPDSFRLMFTPLKGGKSVQQSDGGRRTMGPALPNLPDIDEVKKGKFERGKMNIAQPAQKLAPKCRLKDSRCQSLLEQKKVGSLLPSAPQEPGQMIASADDSGRAPQRDWLSELLTPLPDFIREAGRSVTDAVIGSPKPFKAAPAPVAAPAPPPPPAWPADY